LKPSIGGLSLSQLSVSAVTRLWAAMRRDGGELPETLEAYKAAKQPSESLGSATGPPMNWCVGPLTTSWGG